jgi:alpha-1,2-mannosyltransferase
MRLRLAVRAAYVVALGAAIGWAALIVLASAGAGTLGYDYRAYDLAVDRLLAGHSMYDADAQMAGGFGLFFYPPPFALLVLPLALLPTALGVWVFTALLVAATVAAIRLMPVSARVRWLVLLLAALSWPLIFAIKLGQVGPVLLLLFAIGWRWMDRPRVLGASVGIGTLIKLQPALLIGWALLAGRRQAAVVAIAIVAVAALVATIVIGPQAWLEQASLLSRVSRPVETPHGFGLGRLAFESGTPADIATIIHWTNVGLVLGLVAIVTLLGSATASYLAVVIATQFVSPVLWDHYALVLLLPVAWLLDRGRWWAAAIPLITSTAFVAIPFAYPIAFWAALLGVAWEGLRRPRATPLTA